MYIFEIMQPCNRNQDDKIVELIRQNDRTGITLLFDTYGGAIYGMISRLVNHKTIAEKVLSDTLIRACNQIVDFKPEHSSFFTWIMNIARSLAKDHIFANIKNVEDKNSKPIFDLIVNKGFSIDVVAELLAISKAACAMKLRAELMTINTK
nr:sigma factor [Pedobacter panaciterrae]